jgi:PLP dependent protein
MDEHIVRNVDRILSRISSAAVRCGRDPSGVRLLAATKTRSADEILEAIAAGISLVGENRVQELTEKAARLQGSVDLHFIGHLQRNKVRQVLGLVELIHSVDSVRLAEEIEDRAGKLEMVQRVLVQVNVAGEESKTGVSLEDLDGFVSELTGMAHVDVCGLSTIAPYAEDPEEVRWVFEALREAGATCERQAEGFRCRELSMGMTNDFEVAVEEGSTIVRIGTAIFGDRSRQ